MQILTLLIFGVIGTRKWCPPQRSDHYKMPVTQRFAKGEFDRNQSVPEKGVHYSEVSTIQDERYREVPLYLNDSEKLRIHTLTNHMNYSDSHFLQSTGILLSVLCSGIAQMAVLYYALFRTTHRFIQSSQFFSGNAEMLVKLSILFKLNLRGLKSGSHGAQHFYRVFQNIGRIGKSIQYLNKSSLSKFFLERVMLLERS